LQTLTAGNSALFRHEVDVGHTFGLDVQTSNSLLAQLLRHWT